MPGQIPERFNPVACYVKTFVLPESMLNMPVRISFQGAESCVALWLNGQYVGFSSDSFTPSDFDLTPYLRPGRNKLACRVYRWCAGSWAEDQDFFRFSGLFRDVFLYAVPAVNVEDLKICALLDDDYRDGLLQITAQIAAAEKGRIRFTLKEDEAVVAETEAAAVSGKISAELPVKEPRKWSAEAPCLYQLWITVYDEQGQSCEVIRQNVGFRRFELKNGLMCLNGKRIVFKGVNRHDFCAECGRAVTPDDIRRDLLTMKRNNINAVQDAEMAVKLEPQNLQYQQLLSQLRGGGQWYSDMGSGYGYERSAGDLGKWCCECMAINAICNCCCCGGRGFFCC